MIGRRQGHGHQQSEIEETEHRCDKRELCTFASSVDELLAGWMVQAGDILAQRFRAIEVSFTEDDGRKHVI